MLNARFAQMRPALRAGLTSCTVMALGDVACQAIQRRHKPGQHDWERTARFGLIGLTLHGPYFLWGFGMIDRRFGPAKDLLTAAKKTAFGQVTMFPTYVAAFFAYMTLLETRGDFNAVVDKMRNSYLQTFMAGSVFWPAANMFNFMLVPPSGRVLYVNAAGLLWNTFLSYVNSRAVEQREQQLEQERRDVQSVGSTEGAGASKAR